MTNYTEKTLIKLSNACCVGTVSAAADIAEKELKKYAAVEKRDRNIIGYQGSGKYTLMLAAHIDEVGFIVNDVDGNGFLTVAACGGIDLRHLPSRRVVIHGKKDIKGVFCSVPPHLKGDKEPEFEDIGAFKVDSLLGAEAKKYIAAGDLVTYDETAAPIGKTRVTGKSLDDRAGVVCLLELARRLAGKKLPFKVAYTFTGEEELGIRGAKTAAYYLDPDEAVAIDVSFGDAPDVKPEFCGKLGGGAMIGISPVLDRGISDKLIGTAEQNKIPFVTEILASRTGTDGDMIAIARGGVRTGLLSIPLRNMHSPCEVLDLADVKAVCDILEKYILSGGVKNA